MTNDLSVVAQAAYSSQVKSPSSEILKSDPHNCREVEPQHTSRTDIESKLVQTIKSGRFRAEVGIILNHMYWPQNFCFLISSSYMSA